MTLLHTNYGLKLCNETVTKLQLCTKNSKYDRGTTGVYPMNLITSVTLISVSDFNEIKRTMTLNVLVAMVWNDTRLRLINESPVR